MSWVMAPEDDSRPQVSPYGAGVRPDGVSTATILGGLVRELAKDGFHFTVITTTPHYNRDPNAARRAATARTTTSPATLRGRPPSAKTKTAAKSVTDESASSRNARRRA